MYLVDLSDVGRIALLTEHLLREHGFEVPENWSVGVELLPDTNDGKPKHQQSKYYPEGTGWRERWYIK
jgi:hypothetical protein